MGKREVTRQVLAEEAERMTFHPHILRRSAARPARSVEEMSEGDRLRREVWVVRRLHITFDSLKTYKQQERSSDKLLCFQFYKGLHVPGTPCSLEFAVLQLIVSCLSRLLPRYNVFIQLATLRPGNGVRRKWMVPAASRSHCILIVRPTD